METKLLGADAYANNSLFWTWMGDSIDGWAKATNGGSIVTNSGVLVVATSAGGQNPVASKLLLQTFTPITFDKSRRFKCFFVCPAFSDGIITTVVSGNSYDSLYSYKYFGFKAIWYSGAIKLIGICKNGGSESSTDLLTNFTGGKVEAIFTAGNKVEFYVDDTKYGELTTNLPSGNSPFVFEASIASGSGTTCTINIGEIKVIQDE